MSCHSSFLQALEAFLYKVILCSVCSAVLHMTAAGSNLVINITNEKKEGKKARPVFLAQLNTESLFFILFLLLFLSHTSIIVG